MFPVLPIKRNFLKMLTIETFEFFDEIFHKLSSTRDVIFAQYAFLKFKNKVFFRSTLQCSVWEKINQFNDLKIFK